MEKREYTCIVCPKSCRGTLTVTDNEDYETIGYECKNGEKYAVNEYTDPKRMLTTTVHLNGGAMALLPVVGSGEISKGVFQECLNVLYRIDVEAPVTAGEVVVRNILDTGVDILAARSIGKNSDRKRK